MEQQRRITELQNELTLNIDSTDASGIVRLLHQSDAQLFAGWGTHASVYDTPILGTISKLAVRAADLLKENGRNGAKNMFVFSGCGTSGRIAWLCSRAYNRLLRHIGREPCFRYLIAGGDTSLIVSNELPEDDPPLGAEDLKRLTTGAQRVMYFGITCGLSAPYVAGQVDHGMRQPNFTTVLIGFNPVSMARDSPIEKWNKTCKDVFVELEKLSRDSDSAVILNPVVGPEPITGSSRMKGGSMTEILLDTIFISALSSLLQSSPQQLVANKDYAPSHDRTVQTDMAQENRSGEVNAAGEEPNEERAQEFVHSMTAEHEVAASIVDMFSAVYNAAYRPTEGIASLLELASDCLRHQDGHLYYIGAHTCGVIGLIDGSEMVDTYGAGLDEVRGFVEGGWETCANQEGDLSPKGGLFRISLPHFERDILPNLGSHDCVICLSTDNHSKAIHEYMNKVLSTPAKCGLLVLSTGSGSTQSDRLISSSQQPPYQLPVVDERYQSSVCVSLPHFSVLGVEPIFAGFALKLIVNTISTGANVLKGRVYGNTMINLTLANDKLFYRSVDIVSELSGVEKRGAQIALLKAIYRDDRVEKFLELPVSSHILVATQRNMVIPLAVVLASGRCGCVSEAEKVVSSAHSLRSIVKGYQK